MIPPLTAALAPLADEQGFDLTPLATAERRWDAGMAALKARDIEAFDRIMGFNQPYNRGDAA